ncbi:MAG TPA: hypothetical protein VHE14_02810 [Solirubrobacteraceae bacterium]|nr:hypothetical protein [Solirubrobacteraceae bacterium]
MQEAFGIVILVVVAAASVIALLTFIGSGRLYDQIGRGMFSLRDERDQPPPRAASSGATARERDDEIRQLLGARNARRERRGEQPLDVERELARLTAPAIDPGLRAEVRQLVIARNARRERAGKPALDVETEVDRQLSELGS